MASKKLNNNQALARVCIKLKRKRGGEEDTACRLCCLIKKRLEHKRHLGFYFTFPTHIISIIASAAYFCKVISTDQIDQY